MNILIHHRTLGDGAEGIHIREMIRAFEALGHSVTAVGPSGVGGSPGLVPQIAKRVLPQGLFECAARAHSVVERRRMRRLLSDSRPAFVYARHALNSVGVLQAAGDTGTPSVLEVNALYSSSALQRFEPLVFRQVTRRLEVKALDLASLVVAVSSPLTAMIHELAPNARTLTLPNGVDPQQFAPAIDGRAVRREHSLDGYDLVLGWSGVIRAWHGLGLVLKALVSLKSTALLVVGDGPAREQVERQAADLGVGTQVRFAGQVRREDMPGYLAAIDIGVVADDRTGYASPMKLLEYMAMGKAVVAPNLANIRDIVVHGQQGLLFVQDDIADFTECVDALRDAELRTRLGRCGRVRVLRERNWVVNATAVLQALNPQVADLLEAANSGLSGCSAHQRSAR